MGGIWYMKSLKGSEGGLGMWMEGDCVCGYVKGGSILFIGELRKGSLQTGKGCVRLGEGIVFFSILYL